MSDGDSKKSALDQWLARKNKKTISKGIEKRPAEAPALLSRGQERIWLSEQLHSGRSLYHYARHYDIKGEFSPAYFIKSLWIVVDRHPILKTVYQQQSEKIQQAVLDSYEFPYVERDLSKLDQSGQQSALAEAKHEFVSTPFDLSAAPAFKLYGYKLAKDHYQLILLIHHIAGDAASLRIIHKEVSVLYKAFSTNAEADLTPLPIDYADFAFWQKKQSPSKKNMEYWKDKLSGELPVINLVAEGNKPVSYEGKLTYRHLEPALTKKLKALARAKGVTTFTLFLAIYKLLLAKYTSLEDIIVASPFSNRDQEGLEKLVGFFNETLVLRSEIDQEKDFNTLLNTVNQTIVDALAHKNMPIELLVNELGVSRASGETPLFQTMFLYEESPTSLALGTDIHVEDTMLDTGVSKFGFTLFVTAKNGNIELCLEHSKALEDVKAIALLRHFEHLADQVVAQPSLPLKNLSLLAEAEIKQIITTSVSSEVGSPPADVIKLFDRHVTESPQAIAVSYDTDTITYYDLNEWAKAIAAHIAQEQKEKNQFIGLYVDRSIAMIAGILGILKSGNAYLPLDPTYPADRISYMLADTKASVLLSTSGMDTSWQNDHYQRLDIDSLRGSSTADQSLASEIKPTDLAYIIYTSGSTGKPKGVTINHHQLAHSTDARFDFYDQNPDSFLLLSSFSFDSSVAGIFWTLASGGKLVIGKNRIEQDLKTLSETIESERITHTLMLPSLYQVILQHIAKERLSTLNTVIVAGEACSVKLKESHFALASGINLYNEYGPTEATVWCIAHRVTVKDHPSIPIGKPIKHTQAYILDRYLNLVPKGVIGELYIGGEGVTNGYLNRPDLTEERFFWNPFVSNEKLYKTGDLAELNYEDNIIFHGRADEQVKVRGYRIELNEIKEALIQDDLVVDAVVSVVNTPSGTKKLIAHIISDKEEVEQDITRSLKKKLPSHMFPSAIIQLDRFPLLPNGKIDIQKLPAQSQQQNSASDSESVQPANDKERKLISVWQEVLGRDEISVLDNFFDIGGDSILSIQIITKARVQGLAIKPTQIFEYQTIRELTPHIDHTEDVKLSDQPKSEVIDYPIHTGLSFQQRAFLFHHLQSGEDQGFLQLDFKLSGSIDYAMMQRAWQRVVQLHPVMRTTYHWEDKNEPYQKIHETGQVAISFYDITGQSDKEQQNFIDLEKRNESHKGLSLNELPSSRVILFQISAQAYLISWTCHHINLDGWSATIVFKDMLKAYDAIITGEADGLQIVPNFKQFLDWKNTRDLSDARQYWTEKASITETPLFSLSLPAPQTGRTGFTEQTIYLKTEIFERLSTIGKQHRLTLNTLMQGLWLITLRNFFDSENITVGLTLSGRSSAFPEIERITGLLMNVLPFSSKIPGATTLKDWLLSLQKDLASLRQYEAIEQDQVIRWTEEKNAKPKFDSLFVFGNFMRSAIQEGDLTVEEFNGSFSSTLPITLRVNPSQDFEVNLRYDLAVIDDAVADWLIDQFHTLTTKLASETIAPDQTIASLQTSSYLEDNNLVLPGIDHTSITDDFKAPQNPVQLKLAQQWGKLLRQSSIDINDNFFDLGGSSLTAMDFLGSVEKDFGKKISPSEFLINPTIRDIAGLIKNNDQGEGWKSIVPMKTSGERAPLFCIHSGGAHVMFYKGLARHMHEAQPIYAIQPSGIDGNLPYHDSIYNMAAEYITEMKKLQPQGPYYLLGTCFSNAVGLEMTHQLTASGEVVAALYIIDSGPAYTSPPSPNGERKPVSRMISMVKSGNWHGIYRKLKNRYLRQKSKITADNRTEIEKDLDSMIDNLNHLYTHYEWKPINRKITLVRSSEFSGRKDKKFHLEQWNYLSGDQLETFTVEGHHLTLFEEPEVQGLASALSNHLAQLHEDIKI